MTNMAARFASLLALTLCCGPGPTWARCLTPNGTTPNIREIVKSRCEIYQLTFCDNGESTKRNCSEVADTFIKSFSHKPRCNVSMGSFDEFIQMTRNKVVTSKQRLFWSGVHRLVNRYSKANARMMTLEDTMTGYLVDRLTFCTQTSDPGVTFGSACPAFKPTPSCLWMAEYTFWATASRNFAQQAVGEVSVMINATRSPAFRNTSFFATWEVPNLSSSVKKMNIMMVTLLGEEARETCESDSIKTLKRHLTDKKISWSCTEQPTDVLLLSCIGHQDEALCKQLITSSQSSNELSLCIILMTLLLALFIM